MINRCSRPSKLSLMRLSQSGAGFYGCDGGEIVESNHRVVDDSQIAGG